MTSLNFRRLCVLSRHIALTFYRGRESSWTQTPQATIPRAWLLWFLSLVFCKVKANLVTTLNITLISSLFQRQISFTRGLLCPNQTSVCHTDFQSHPPLKNISCFLDWQECRHRLAARLGVVSDYAPQHSSPQLYVPPVSLFSTCCSQRWGCSPLESSTVVLFEKTSIYLLRVEKWDHYLYPGLKFSRMVCFLTVLWVH